jgi:hypothetical protein
MQCTIDNWQYVYIQNFREKLKAGHTVDEIQSYQKNWLQHVKRMEHSRIHRMALEYEPKGKRDIGRPKQDGEINSIFKIEFAQYRTQVFYICLRS